MSGVSVSVVGRPAVIPAQALFVVHAMGIGLWTVLIGGALVGQLSVIVPIVVLGACPGTNPAVIDASVARAVTETLKYRADLEPTTSTLTPAVLTVTGRGIRFTQVTPTVTGERS